ncbi:BON domain-containing protein [Methyloversatilis sp. XJ19-49]|uniref:BON domain-containing protein n=1 Tax=Methyloversatilis sp. XJ19-49 TaxID=2963429 RepID=UPI00211CC007|nr:BON domain-containing protein [Methyloversatilis sp. XJ19-49]MCQ9379299.1 BON domain-containing protein [Methyloversatilis sp. XJ19-49]
MPNFQTRGQAAAPPNATSTLDGTRAALARCTGAALLGLMLSACGPKEEPVALSEPTVDKELAIVLNQTEQVAEDVKAQAGRVAYEADIDAAAERRAAIRRDALRARAEAEREAAEAAQTGVATEVRPDSRSNSLPDSRPDSRPSSQSQSPSVSTSDPQAAAMAADDLPPTAAGQPADAAPPVDDAVITAQIEALIEKDAELAALDIDVATLDGKVILSGTAPSEALRARAAELAVTIDGVIGILNQVIVKPA